MLYGRMAASRLVTGPSDEAESLDSSENIPRKRVRIEDVSPGAFKWVLGCVYALSPTLDGVNCAEVLYATEKYLLKDLFEFTMTHVKRTVFTRPLKLDALVSLLRDLALCGMIDVRKRLMDELDTSDFDTLLSSPHFKELPMETVEKILKNDEMATFV